MMVPKKPEPDHTAWDLQDFIDALDETMELQAQANPALRQTHAQLDPQWKEIHSLINQLLTSPSGPKQHEIVEALVARGELGARALIDALLKFREMLEGKSHHE